MLGRGQDLRAAIQQFCICIEGEQAVGCEDWVTQRISAMRPGRQGKSSAWSWTWSCAAAEATWVLSGLRIEVPFFACCAVPGLCSHLRAEAFASSQYH